MTTTITCRRLSVSSVDVLCYPTSLLSNFTFYNSSAILHTGTESSANGTSVADAAVPLNLSASLDSAVPTSASAPFVAPIASSTATSTVTAESQSTGESAVVSSPSSTLWWSPPLVATALAIKPEGVSPPSEAAQAWGPLRRLRRWIQLEKRDEKALSAYSYGCKCSLLRSQRLRL